LLNDALGTVGLIPEAGFALAGIELIPLRDFRGDVKETSGVRPNGWSGLQSGDAVQD